MAVVGAARRAAASAAARRRRRARISGVDHCRDEPEEESAAKASTSAGSDDMLNSFSDGVLCGEAPPTASAGARLEIHQHFCVLLLPV